MSQTDADSPLDPVPPPRRKRSLLGRLRDRARSAGERVVHSTLDRLLGAPAPSDVPAAPPASETVDPALPGDAQEIPVSPEAQRRLGILHGVTERLRGAANEYIAAKLDEIEARVDVKLDEVEKRIDGKIIELHQELLKMRDEELRHRLRILKLTLVFTVLVALLSLGYKLVIKFFAG